LKILVLVKQVPDPNALRLDASGSFPSNTARVVNEYDQYALEAAVQIKEQNSDADVTVVAIGPASAKDAVTRGLAMGADQGILIQGDPGELDALQTASLLADIAREVGYDIILVGQETSDSGTGNVGPHLAGLLGLPLVSNVVELEVGDNGMLKMGREVEDGRHVVSAPTPVVICALTGLNEPRYPSLKGIMAARRKPIEEKQVGDFSLAESSMTWGGYRQEERAVEGIMIDEEPEAAAKQVVALLKERNLI
jgi:electron transfer flavoprotein beta subunit